MPTQIDTPPWTLSGWLWGMVGIYAAMLYVGVWYFLFMAPLILVTIALEVVISSSAENVDSSLEIASLVMSYLSYGFLIWQFFCFVGPTSLDILRSSGLFMQRAHSLTPTSAIAMMRQRRKHASQQLSNLLSWLSLPFRSDRS